MGFDGRSPSNSNGDLENLVPPRAEQFVSLGDVIQGKTMGDQGLQIDSLGFDHAHQSIHSLSSAGAQRRDDGLIGKTSPERLDGDVQMTGVDAYARDNPAGPDASESVLESRLASECFDRYIHASSPRLGKDRRDGILSGRERIVCAEVPGYAEAA